jgi:ABC-type transport system involved in Fe-S cluster assembly fused permease/ATPase subunit
MQGSRTLQLSAIDGAGAVLMSLTHSKCVHLLSTRYVVEQAIKTRMHKVFCRKDDSSASVLFIPLMHRLMGAVKLQPVSFAFLVMSACALLRMSVSLAQGRHIALVSARAALQYVISRNFSGQGANCRH